MPLIDLHIVEAIKTRQPVFCVVAILFFVSISSGQFLVWLNRPIPFSSTAWTEHEHLRPRMVDDLLKNRNLMGLTKPALEELLGVPSSRHDWSGERYTYRIAPGGGKGTLLVIEFGSGRVKSVRTNTS